MDVIISYQQDTVVVKSLLKALPQVNQGNLNVRRAPVALDAIPERDSSRIIRDTTPPPPTFAQIRYWRWRREQKMLVDTSRYISPRNDVELTSSVKVDDKGLGLPIHKISRVNTDWLTILLLLILMLFATIRSSYSKYLGHLFQSIFNYPTSFRMFREKNYSISHGAFRLEVYFYITLSIFVYQLLNHFQIEYLNANFLLFTLCFFGVLIYFVFKKMTYRMLGSVIEGRNETSEYLFNLDNFNRVTGLSLYPIVSFIAFYPFENSLFPVVLGILVVSGFYLLLLQRGILILMKKQFSVFYLFLYLCTLEFLPLLLIYKVVVE